MISKEAFLNILMTQLKYQDPLNPTDTNQFLSQLAQISQVEQLTNISSTLDSIASSNSASSINQWLSVIGKKIGVTSTTLSTGDQVNITPAADYDKVVLNLTASDGTVTQQTFNKGDALTYTYTGSNPVTLSSYALKGSSVVSCTNSVYRLVQSVQSGSSGLIAIASNGDQYPLSSVTEIKN